MIKKKEEWIVMGKAPERCPIGLVGGALGKKKQCYYCGKCGFNHEY